MATVPDSATDVRRDPRLEPGAFRWPAERPPFGAEFGFRTKPPERSWEWWAQRAGLAAGVLLAAWIYLGPVPGGLAREGKDALAVFVLCTTLWITNWLPYGVTGLTGIALLALTRAIPPADAYAAFGSKAIFFLLGIFVIAGALVETGLSKRCALFFLRRFEASPDRFAVGMLLAGAFGTIWMPSQATVAMLFPIAMEVLESLRVSPRDSPYARLVLFSLGWGAIIGSNASFLGSSRASLALGMLQRYGESISFSQWMLAAAPLVVLGLAVTPFALRLTIPRERVEFTTARQVLEHSVATLGPMRGREYRTLGILLLTVAAWVFLGERRVDLAVISLLGAAAVFVFRVATWQQVERHVYWNIILMYGGAIALGSALERSGAAAWILMPIVRHGAISPFVTVAGTALVALVLSEFVSNAAALTVVLPLSFAIGSHSGVSPVALTFATSFGAGLDFMFPMSTAPNTIIFASGYLRPRHFLSAGLVMTAASIALLLLVIRFWWPIVGVL